MSLRQSDVDGVPSVNTTLTTTTATRLLHAQFLQSRLDDERGIYLADLVHAAQEQEKIVQAVVDVADGAPAAADDDDDDALSRAAAGREGGDGDSDSSEGEDADEEEDDNKEAVDEGPNPALRAVAMGSLVQGTVLQVKPYVRRKQTVGPAFEGNKMCRAALLGCSVGS